MRCVGYCSNIPAGELLIVDRIHLKSRREWWWLNRRGRRVDFGLRRCCHTPVLAYWCGDLHEVRWRPDRRGSQLGHVVVGAKVVSCRVGHPAVLPLAIVHVRCLLELRVSGHRQELTSFSTHALRTAPRHVGLMRALALVMEGACVMTMKLTGFLRMTDEG